MFSMNKKTERIIIIILIALIALSAIGTSIYYIIQAIIQLFN